MGKGSKPRPMDKQKFDENFDQIFKKETQCLVMDEKEGAERNKGQ